MRSVLHPPKPHDFEKGYVLIALHFILDTEFYQLYVVLTVPNNNSLAVKRNHFDIIETFSNFLNAPLSSNDYYLPLTVNMAPIKNSLIPN